MAFFLPRFIERLAHPAPGVRRVAALDLAASRLTPDHARAAADALAAAIGAETDPPTRIALIRAIASIGALEHLPPLAALRDDPATPVAIAHAAILAHDAIQARARSQPDA